MTLASTRTIAGEAATEVAPISNVFGQSAPHFVLNNGALVGGSANVDDSATLGPLAVVDQGAFIGAGTQLGAGSRVGENANVGPGCTIGANVEVGDGAIIGAGSTVEDLSEIAPGAVLPPDSYLPSRTRVGGGPTLSELTRELFTGGRLANHRRVRANYGAI